jgi:hypothetical protein
MISRNNVHNGPVMRAAKMALETGNADHILIWVPEESENTLKNLLEKTCCERTTQRKARNHSIEWYLQTINRLHSEYYRPHDLNISTKTPEERKTILLVERACETGNFDEIATVMQITSDEEIRQRFNDVLNKSNYDMDNIAAGRAYVSAFTDFIACINSLRSGSRREAG